MSTTSLYSMEIEQIASVNNYGSLTENTLNAIRGQEYALYEPIWHAQAPFSLLSLRDIHNHFCDMPEDDKKATLKTMSTQLLLLSCVATCLPEELVKDHICFFMMDGCKPAAEKFYVTPLLEHFELYHDIKVRLADDTKPIGPLYAASQKDRNMILHVKTSHASSVPVICRTDKKVIDQIEDSIRDTYLKGMTVSVVRDSRIEECIEKGACYTVTGVLILDAFVTGGLFGVSIVACGKQVVCQPCVASSFALLPTGLLTLLASGDCCHKMQMDKENVIL